ncbi:1598_t:CDS:2, partial [Acaulospora morrowiae]
MLQFNVPLLQSLLNQHSRTSAPGYTVHEKSQLFIATIIEDQGVASEVEICFIDIRTSECILSQIADSQTYVKTLHKINIYNLAEILLSVIIDEPSKLKLCKILEDNILFVTIVSIERKYFNNAT